MAIKQMDYLIQSFQLLLFELLAKSGRAAPGLLNEQPCCLHRFHLMNDDLPSLSLWCFAGGHQGSARRRQAFQEAPDGRIFDYLRVIKDQKAGSPQVLQVAQYFDLLGIEWQRAKFIAKNIVKCIEKLVQI